MEKKKAVRYSLIFFFLLLIIFIYFKFSNKKSIVSTQNENIENNQSNSNIINEVNYISSDRNGNDYMIYASRGEIDLSNSSIIFLTNVKAQINLQNSEIIEINSDFGKYNIKNFDTIFSKNVVITYLNNKITGEYLDFSLDRSSMVISRNVVYTNLENILKTDVIEIDINTKNTKIFMYDNKQKVNIKSKN